MKRNIESASNWKCSLWNETGSSEATIKCSTLSSSWKLRYYARDPIAKLATLLATLLAWSGRRRVWNRVCGHWWLSRVRGRTRPYRKVAQLLNPLLHPLRDLLRNVCMVWPELCQLGRRLGVGMSLGLNQTAVDNENQC